MASLFNFVLRRRRLNAAFAAFLVDRPTNQEKTFPPLSSPPPSSITHFLPERASRVPSHYSSALSIDLFLFKDVLFSVPTAECRPQAVFVALWRAFMYRDRLKGGP